MKQLRSRTARAAAGLALALAAGLVAPVADAAPPANDTLTQARRIPRVPFRAVQGTRAATGSARDGECVAGASVWYRFRPRTTTRARVVTVGSGYDTVLAVFRGPAGKRTLLRCDDDGVGSQSATRMVFRADRTYWIAVSACCTRGARGGRMVLRLYRDRPASVTARLGSVRSGGVSGRLLVRGTVRCATPSVAAVEVTASQRNGDAVARGYQLVELPSCTRRPMPWRMVVDSETGWAFRPGRAVVDATAYSFDGFANAQRGFGGTVTVRDSPDARRGR